MHNALSMRHIMFTILVVLLSLGHRTPIGATTTKSPQQSITRKKPLPQQQRIRNIIVSGNKHIKTEAILRKLPYKKGTLFSPDKSADAIKALYALGHFYQVQLEREDIDDRSIDLYVIVQENPLLERVIFSGNTKVRNKKLTEELNLAKVETVSEEFMHNAEKTMKQIYREEGYHYASIQGKLLINKEVPDKASIEFTIEEGPKSAITRVTFVGNKHIPSRKLSKIIFTRERWLLSLLDQSGQYNEEMLAIDKQRIAFFYRDHGFLMAKVIEANVEFSNNKSEIYVTFNIDEGKQFTVRNIAAPGDDIFLEQDLLPLIALEEDKPFSQSKMAKTVERLKSLWGEKGYINADVYPNIVPDEATKKVDVTFVVERGNKVYVDRIDITGNQLTHDKVIRRKVALQEGDLITSKKLQESQDAVEHLSFFEHGGVNWKIHRQSDELADLELQVREAKTAQISFNLSYGSEQFSNKRAVKAGLQMQQLNFMGQGIGIRLQTQLQLSRHGSQFFEGHIINPYLFDTNISGRLAGYHRKQEFDEWQNVNKTPQVRESGGIVAIGTFLPNIDKYLELEVEAGFEYLNSRKLKARKQTTTALTESLQKILEKGFTSSPLQWFTISLLKDTRNHLIYPNRGYKILLSNKLALPFFNKHYGFLRADLGASYYTPLIGRDSLVLMLHGQIGTIQKLGKSKHIPYRELFHVGGQKTVRGFRFGQIGPSWNNIDPLGARYMVIANIELIFPLIPDYSMKGHVFYDAGAGWNTPKRGLRDTSLIRRNKINLRHAVGFGLNLVRPYPAKIDWGYKIGRNRGANESAHEFHLSMNVAY